jgi:hypothetical protein
MLAAVAGSIGVAGAAALGVAAGCSSFLPQPARRTRPNEAAKPQTAMEVLFFMFCSTSLEILIAQTE